MTTSSWYCYKILQFLINVSHLFLNKLSTVMQKSFCANNFQFSIFPKSQHYCYYFCVYWHIVCCVDCNYFPQLFTGLQLVCGFSWNRISCYSSEKNYIFLIKTFVSSYSSYFILLKWDAIAFLKLFLFNNKAKYFNFDFHSFLSKLLSLFDIFWEGFICVFVLCVVILNIYLILFILSHFL